MKSKLHHRYESGVYKYRSVVHALGSIYTHEGLRGLTCGLLPTILRDAPFSGIYYMVLMELKYLNLPGFSHVGNTFISGVIAGSLASVLVHPADVVKTK
jgi:solute carrier family 25 protein 38